MEMSLQARGTEGLNSGQEMKFVEPLLQLFSTWNGTPDKYNLCRQSI